MSISLDCETLKLPLVDSHRWMTMGWKLRRWWEFFFSLLINFDWRIGVATGRLLNQRITFWCTVWWWTSTRNQIIWSSASNNDHRKKKPKVIVTGIQYDVEKCGFVKRKLPLIACEFDFITIVKYVRSISEITHRPLDISFNWLTRKKIALTRGRWRWGGWKHKWMNAWKSRLVELWPKRNRNKLAWNVSPFTSTEIWSLNSIVFRSHRGPARLDAHACNLNELFPTKRLVEWLRERAHRPQIELIATFDSHSYITA